MPPYGLKQRRCPQFPMPHCDLYIAASARIGVQAAMSDAHPRTNVAPVTPCEPKFSERGEDLSGL